MVVVVVVVVVVVFLLLLWLFFCCCSFFFRCFSFISRGTLVGTATVDPKRQAVAALLRHRAQVTATEVRKSITNEITKGGQPMVGHQ